MTGARLIELGVGFAGYDHYQNCYIGVVIPAGVEAALIADPLIEIEQDSAPAPRHAGPVWSSAQSDAGPLEMGRRLRKLRATAGLDIQTAAALSGGKLSAETIERIERTGICDVCELVALADLYAASLDHIAGRAVIGGNRRR